MEGYNTSLSQAYKQDSSAWWPQAFCYNLNKFQKKESSRMNLEVDPKQTSWQQAKHVKLSSNKPQAAVISEACKAMV